ncbi:MAG: hypothetical protein ACD_76C00073G0001, partial [uncultured bacterium]
CLARPELVLVEVSEADGARAPGNAVELIAENIVFPVIDSAGAKIESRVVLGQPCGASNRRMDVDSYGGIIPHGSCSFSGKDPFHPERAGAYMARYVAKSIVASGLAKNLFVTLAYSKSQKAPVVVRAVSGTGEDLSDVIKAKFDFRPEAIVEHFGLCKPIYQQTAVYGHFGRDMFPWEDV